MLRIFVHEHFTGNAPHPGDPDAAALREAGVAMRDAVVADLLRVPGVAVTCSVDDPRSADAPPFAAGPRFSTATAAPGETPESFVHREAARHDACWVVAPETGGLLAGLQAAVRDTGPHATHWIGCDARALSVAGSKRRTVEALAARGLPTPRAFAADPHVAWIVKPDDGAGTLHTRRHADRAAALLDARRRAAAGRAVVLEPCVEGEPLSLSLVVGSDLARVAAINRQRIRVGPDGTLSDAGVQVAALDARDPRAAPLRALALDVVAALPGLRGFVGIDLVWNEERGPVLIEVNPRVTCAYAGVAALRAAAAPRTASLAEEILRLFLPAGALDAVRR